MSKLSSVTCENILDLMSRNLDGDLNKSETSEVYHHVKSCMDCQVQMDEMAGLELQLSMLSDVYAAFNLDDQFNKKIAAAITQEERKSLLSSQWRRLKSHLKVFNPLTSSRLFPVGMGAVGTFAVLVTLWSQIPTNQNPNVARFSVEEIPISQAEDAVNWNHEQTISPGQSAVFAVSEADKQSYYFRMDSSKPVPVAVRHQGQNSEEGGPQTVTIDGVRYATLKTPQADDSVMIRNEGNSPIRVLTHTSQPKAMNVSLKKAGN